MADNGKSIDTNSLVTADAELNLPPDCKRVFDNCEIITAVDQLAQRLNLKLQNLKPVVLCVMQGGLIFSGHLIPRLNCMLEIDYIHATRYNNQTTGDELKWKAYPATSLKNRTVLIIDDILDEGLTLQAIIKYCESQGATDIFSAVLLKKLHDRISHETHNIEVSENIALTVTDQYVFGFGMDLNGRYRQLPHIYAITGSDT